MSEISKTDPRLGDVLSKTSGRVIRHVGPTGKVAYAARLSESAIRHWKRGTHSNLVHRVSEFLTRLAHIGANPELILAHFEGVVMRARFKSLTADGLIELWWETQPLEAKLEGEENEAWADFPRTGDLDAGIDADLAEIAVMKRRVGASYECQRRGIDPRVGVAL